MKAQDLIIGGRYNWKNQPERLVYRGSQQFLDGRWYQFANVGAPDIVWCEVRMDELQFFEETKEATT